MTFKERLRTHLAQRGSSYCLDNAEDLMKVVDLVVGFCEEEVASQTTGDVATRLRSAEEKLATLEARVEPRIAALEELLRERGVLEESAPDAPAEVQPEVQAEPVEEPPAPRGRPNIGPDLGPPQET